MRKVVIPAGGLGTRLLPATRAVPKELLPVVDRPMIHYVVEEAVASGIDQVVLVLSREKGSLADYFDRHPELERSLEEKREHQLLELVRRTSRMARFLFVRQQEPLGLGHAVYCARHAVGDEPFAVLLPDDILVAETPGLAQLLRVWEERRAPVIGVERVPPERVSAYGIIGGRQVAPGLYRLDRVVEKPSPAEAPSDLAIVGRYILVPAVFPILERVPPGAKGEIQLTDAIAALVREGPVYAWELQGIRYDVGNPLGLLKASVALALQHPQIGPSLRDWLREVVGP